MHTPDSTRNLFSPKSFKPSISFCNSLGGSPVGCRVDPINPGQDKFIKQCQKTHTETERNSNKQVVGWYSEDDMKNDLKWTKNLDLLLKNVVDSHGQKNFQHRIFHNECVVWLIFSVLLRTKIAGAIQVCMQDQANLVRQDIPQACPFYHLI